MSRTKRERAYRGRAAVPRPGGPMKDRRREADRKAARGWKCKDHEWFDEDHGEWFDDGEYGGRW